MRHFSGRGVGEPVIVALDEGEDVLLSIKEVIAEEEIKNGVIVSGAGSLSKARYHIVDEDEEELYNDRYITKKGWFEIVSLSGVIANGEPHVHICLSQNDEGFGGHLEEGSKILTLAEIVILKLDIDMERKMSARGYGRLFQA